MSKYPRRTAVYIATVPEDWRPSSPWTFPPEILGGHALVRNVPSEQAKATARSFNLGQLQAGMTDHQWAIVVPCLRPSHWRAGSAALDALPQPAAVGEAIAGQT